MKTGDKIRTAVLWKYVVKVSVLCVGLVLSLNTHAGRYAFQCDDDYDNVEMYNKDIEFLKKHPNDIVMIYYAGLNAFCIGKEREGLHYIEKASFLGHVAASSVTGDYYSTDGTMDLDRSLTKDPENFNAAIYYYERAASQIEENPRYPEGTIEDMPYLEQTSYTSAGIFGTLPYFYYKGYVRAIQDTLRTNSKYSDLTEVLVKMLNSAERCLQRPSLAAWKSKRQTIWNILQERCGAMKDFAGEILILEQERAAIAGGCSRSLGECPEHKEIVDQIKAASRFMWDTINAVPTLASIQH